MKILITGTSGLIGSALAAQLEQRGHTIVRAVRRLSAAQADSATAGEEVAVDFAQPLPSHWWLPHLQGIDAVVAFVGIFQEAGPNTFEAIHTQAPAALFRAADEARVPWVVQISALGADDNAVTPFHTSKRAADEVLRHLAVKSVIVQPSLVYAPQGKSAALFNRIAVLPVWVLPAVTAPIQPVHLNDVVEAVTAMLEHPPANSCTVHAVGPQPMVLKDYLRRLRKVLGLPHSPLVLEVPLPWIAAVSRAWAAISGRPPQFASADALHMLAQGNAADPCGFGRWLTKPSRPVESFLAPHDRDAAREQAQLQNLLVWMRFSVAAVWIATGLLSLGLYPVNQSLQLLGDFGLHGRWALAALYAGALLDLALGLAMLLVPARWLAWVWRAQLLVIVGYTLLITVRIPHWWLHPFGPLLKNLPMLVGIAMLAALTRRR